MLAQERRLRIVQMLNERDSGVVSVVELTAYFHVSGMTIRRDLDWLQTNMLLTRVHGGAVVNRSTIVEKSFNARRDEFSIEKCTIGWAAAQLVGDGERVILDAGTTTLQIAHDLADRSNLTVVTTALPVAMALAKDKQCSTIILGGILKDEELCVVGPSVTEQLAHLSVDKVFLSASGFSVEQGITDADFMEVAAKQAMIRASREVVLVADSSKWDTAALVQIAPLSAVDRLVTDDAIAPSAIVAIEAEGVEVITAERLRAEAVEDVIEAPELHD